MAFSDAKDRLALAELIIYSLLFIPTIYVCWKHGKVGMVAWPSLASICILRIAADALHISRSRNPKIIGSGMILTSSGSLALLVLTPFGIIYEAAYYIPSIPRWPNRINLVVLHLTTTAAITIATIGGTQLTTGKHETAEPSNPLLEHIGYIILLGLCFVILAQSLYLLLRQIKQLQALQGLNHRATHLRKLLYCTIASLPFAAIRLAHMVSYSYNRDPSLDPQNGSFATVFAVVFLMQLFATISMFVGGFLSRGIAEKEDSREEEGRVPVREHGDGKGVGGRRVAERRDVE